MATYTPNLNLGKPEATDPFGNFRQLFNDNMDILDTGGGGSGGHTIVDPSGTDMPAESKLQFTGGVTVTDDNVNGKTVVDISGGGGNVYGAFIDTNRVLASGNIPQGSSTYTATEDCALLFTILSDSNNSAKIEIDGIKVWEQYDQNGINSFANFLFVRSGQNVTFTQSYSSNGNYKAYGLTQGTNGIFTPIIYSDTERVIGVWRDNKPLYQITIQTGYLPNNSSMYISTPSNIENLVHYSGYIYSPNSPSNQRPLPFPSGGSNDVRVDLDEGVIRIMDFADWSTYNGYLTVQYTKTTDVAGSGNWNTDGVPTVHYSTSEQVIGTWIDGKPLYAITVDFGSIPSNATKEVDHNITNLKMTVGFEGTMMSGSVCETLPSGENSNFRLQTTSTKLRVITGASWSGWDDSYITLKYTKTTD